MYIPMSLIVACAVGWFLFLFIGSVAVVMSSRRPRRMRRTWTAAPKHPTDSPF